MHNIEETHKLLQQAASETAIVAASLAQDLRIRLITVEQRFEEILSSVEDAVLFVNSRSKVLCINEAARELFGYIDDDTRNASYYIPGEIEYEGKKYKNFDELLMMHKYDNLSLSVEAFNRFGQLIILEVSVNSIESVSSSYQHLLIIRDRTAELEHVKYQGALWKALNSASDSICIIDDTDSFIFCNTAFVKLVGYNSYKQIVGKPANTIKREWGEFKASVTVPRSTWIGGDTCTDKEGKDIPCITTVIPVMNGKPDPIYYICTQKPIEIPEE